MDSHFSAVGKRMNDKESFTGLFHKISLPSA